MKRLESAERKKVIKLIELVTTYIAYAAILLVVLFPIYWLINTSLKPASYFSTAIFSSLPQWVPMNPSFENYVYAWVTRSSWHFISNSLIISTLSTILAILIGSVAAYGIIRFKAGGKNFPIGILYMRMMPPIAIVVPWFLMFKTLRLTDTHLALILVYTTMNLPFAVWILMGFLREVPKELEEAAMVDGCSMISSFFRVTFPLAAPGLAVAGLFCFVFAWDEFLAAVILTRTAAATVTMSIGSYHTGYEIAFNQMSAFAVMITIPVIVVSLLLQKYLVRGLTMGAVKG